MDWRRMNGFLLSDPDGFAINRTMTDGRVYYMAVKLGKAWKPRKDDPPGGVPRAWDGSTIVHVERDVDSGDEVALRAALARCKSKCEEVANG